MLGDKLTAFAPHTTGIPFYKNGDERFMEIMKQLYDVSSILDGIDDLTEVRKTDRPASTAVLIGPGISRLGIYYTMQLVKPDVATICTEMAVSMGVVLLCAGAERK